MGEVVLSARISKTISVVFGGFVLAACNGALESSVPKHERPVPSYLVKKMTTKGMTLGAPLLLRIYKQENVLEVWKQDHTDKYALLNTYEICKWSGKPGPKFKEGDRQAPEGFYHVTPGLMNPNSSYHLSFNMGFPNTYDRANDRTGSYLMIHGACSSAGCYSMTDEYVEEIYALARESFKGGQKAFQIQAFPFRMTPENLAKNVNSENFEFWTMLKEGSDYFEITKRQPKVDVCEKRYVFNRNLEEGERFKSRAQCPPTNMPRSLATAFKIRQDSDQEKFNRIMSQLKLSPFVKDDERPRVSTASIKAKSTVGPLVLTDPQPVLPPPGLEEPSAENVQTPTAPLVTAVPQTRQEVPASATAEPATPGAPTPRPAVSEGPGLAS